jgi:hypothetical protein
MRTFAILPALAAVFFIAAGCAGPGAAEVADSPGESAQATAQPLGFPTGPAVLVAPDHDPPDDRVDSTGAYLPVNGKPTLVYLEAIW